MPVPSAHSLLAAWERGKQRHPIDRALLVYALAEPEADPDALADKPLGERNAALLRLRRATLGNRLRGYADCPSCATRLEFELDATTLLAKPPAGPPTVEVEGVAFRPPTSRDLAAIVGEGTPERAALRLLRRCTIEPDERSADSALEPLLEAVETALEEADPLADLNLELRCEACGRSWSVPLDLAAFLWEEIEAYAGRLVDDVHVLARAYGWSESAILALPEGRRAAYLERVAI